MNEKTLTFTAAECRYLLELMTFEAAMFEPTTWNEKADAERRKSVTAKIKAYISEEGEG